MAKHEQELTKSVSKFLEKQRSLQASLQVCRIDPNNRTLTKQQESAGHADSVKNISTLQVAVRRGLAKIARDIIDRNPALTLEVDSFGKSALNDAAKAGRGDLLGKLLRAGAQPWLLDHQGKSPLYYAARHGRTNMMSSLLASGSHPNPVHLASPALQAARRERDEIVSSELGQALRSAAKAGELGVVEKLLKFDVSPDLEKKGESALMIAICRGHEDILKVLLDAGVHPCCPDLSPSNLIRLHHAIRHDHVDLAAMLLDYGAEI
ncbi:hypothetical protein OEA41_010527 [Lepraria neglecta]|uniref:Ankyrin n=1 Tax=Lepraria neglecta TaxID=209136 RepID=A0AAD9YXH5_9LECA|nr:hypothetical protein OEA41_010527 [Lepraria neglecta]